MKEIANARHALFTALAERKTAREIAGGQSHFVEVIIVVLIVVVIGIFIYTGGIPGLQKLWNDAMALIGTIQP